MIKIGVVNIDTSHPKMFADYLNKSGRARYAAVYNDGFRGDDEVDGFIRLFGLERRCKSIEELAEATDIGFIQGCDWDRHIECAMPFLKIGKPVFIDKPVVGNLRECRKLEELAASGKAILGSSSVRYAQEIVEFSAQPEAQRGKILNVFGTAGADEFNYAIHVSEGFGGILGTGAVSTAFVGGTQIDGKTNETFYVRFANAVTATYCVTYGVWQPFEFVITTTKSTFHFRIDTGRIYGALLDRICDAVEQNKREIVPMPGLTESVKLMLAGRISRARGGGEVRLAEIPANDPGFDGAAFARGYAMSAPKIYLK